MLTQRRPASKAMNPMRTSPRAFPFPAACRAWGARLAGLVALAVLVCAGAGELAATEFGATHVVFEKATKMKKVEVSMYLAALDQTDPDDDLSRERRLRCTVAASGKNGSLPVKGAVELRLVGTADGSEPWEGTTLSVSPDPLGDVSFEAQQILDLVDEARASGAEPELFRVDFDGGKGKKVVELTMDCLHDRAE